MPEILGVNFLRPSDRYFCMKQNADVWEFGRKIQNSRISNPGQTFECFMD